LYDTVVWQMVSQLSVESRRLSPYSGRGRRSGPYTGRVQRQEMSVNPQKEPPRTLPDRVSAILATLGLPLDDASLRQR